MFRSSAASVRLAEVTNTASSSATTALACKTPDGPSGSRDLGIVVHRRPRGSRPVRSPKAVGESPHEFARRTRVPPSALDVQQERDVQGWRGVHSLRQPLERARPVEVGVAGGQDRVRSRPKQFLVHATRVSGVDSGHLWSGPDQVRARRAVRGLLDGADPRRAGWPRDPHAPQRGQGFDHVLTAHAHAQHGLEGRQGGRHGKDAGLERIGKPPPQMGWQDQQRLRHTTAPKKAAPVTPTTGTTRARSR